MYIFTFTYIYVWISPQAYIYTYLYFVFILLVKWCVCLHSYLYSQIWQVGAQNEETLGQLDLDGNRKRNVKMPTLLLGFESKCSSSLFSNFKTTSESLINTELTWEEKVFTTPPLDNSKAAQVFLQWLEGMECWENHSTGNKADWFYLNFLYPTEAHFTCE